MKHLLRTLLVFCVAAAAAVAVTACANSNSSSSSGAQSQEQQSYHWENFIDLANIDKQVCRIEERDVGRVGVVAETSEEMMSVPANYRLIGRAKADDSISIYEVTDENGKKVYRAYGERRLYQEDGGGKSHSVAVRRGFVDILFLAEEVDCTADIQGGYENLDSLKKEYPVVSTSASDKGVFHYAMKDCFSECPDDRRLMEAQGTDYDLLPSE